MGGGEVSCIVSRPDGCKRLAAQHLQFAMAQTATDRLGEVKVRAWLWKLTIRPGLAHCCRHTHTHTHISVRPRLRRCQSELTTGVTENSTVSWSRIGLMTGSIS